MKGFLLLRTLEHIETNTNNLYQKPFTPVKGFLLPRTHKKPTQIIYTQKPFTSLKGFYCLEHQNTQKPTQITDTPTSLYLNERGFVDGHTHAKAHTNHGGPLT